MQAERGMLLVVRVRVRVRVRACVRACVHVQSGCCAERLSLHSCSHVHGQRSHAHPGPVPITFCLCLQMVSNRGTKKGSALRACL